MTNKHTEPRLELTLVPLVDRHGHRIVLVHREEKIPVLESVEGTADDAWPPSPPLQQIHEQTLASGPVVWGLGAAGSGHWSASFSWENNDQFGSPRLNMELALRSSGAIVKTGSTYRLPDPQSLFEISRPTKCRLTCRLSGHTAIQICITGDPNQVDFIWNPDQREFSICPLAVWKAQSPTIAWSYSVQICPAPIN